MNLKKIKGEIFSHIDLSPYTTFKIGGKVSHLVCCVDLEDLKNVLSICNKEHKKIFLLGAGSNVLFKSNVHDLVVIKLSGNDFKNINVEKNILTVGAGLSLSKAIIFSAEKGLKGLEIFAGIPATVGGAVYMNAGAKKHIGSFIRKVQVMDMGGNFNELTKTELDLEYRSSGLNDNIIVQVEFELENGLRQNILCEYEKVLESKKNIQPLDKNSAGCVFKNPDLHGISAGKLIEECGLKGFAKGGAQVSTKHANFIINNNNATSDDVLFLINKIKDVVKKNKNIDLKQEIIVI